MRMRLVVLTLAAIASLQPQRPADNAFVGVGVWYAGPGAQPPSTNTGDVDALRRDLAVLRRAGFNAITTWIAWRDAEPQRGAYALAGLERLVAAAAEADLRVAIVAYTETRPSWAQANRDSASGFTGYLLKRLAIQRNVLGVGDTSGPDDVIRERIEVTAATAPQARLAMWAALSGGRRYFAFHGAEDPLSPAVLSLGETAGVISRNQALFAPLRPRQTGVARMSGDVSGVEIRLLESAAALMIIGVNRANAPRKVMLAFTPDIPEAIWQNFETGTMVNFVMQKEGPTFEYTFGPHDALVLMIGKKLR
jgi:hypothetical protein